MIPKETIPEGLEYQDQYWQMALDQIKRKERLMALYRWLGIASAILLITTVALWQTAGSDGLMAHQAKNSLDGAIAQQLIAKGPNIDQNNESIAIANQNENSSGNYELNSDGYSASESLNTSSSASLNTTSAGSSNDQQNDNTKSSSLQIAERGRGSGQENNDVVRGNIISSSPEDQNSSTAGLTSNNQGHSLNDQYKLTLKMPDHGVVLDGAYIPEDNEGNQISDNSSSESAETVVTDATNLLGSNLAIPNVKLSTSSSSSMLEVPNWNASALYQLNPIQIAVLPTVKREPVLVSASIEDKHSYFPISRWSIQLTLGNAFRTDFGSRINATSLQPVIGLGVEHNFNKKWGILIKPSYSQVSDVLQSFETQSIEFDYIFRRQSTSINTNKLHLVNVPLSISRRLGDRHQIRLGAGLNYLMTVNNTLIESESTSFESNTVGTSTDKGYTQGWEDFGTFGLIGYNFYLRPDMSIGLNYQHGFTDMTQDNWFQEVDNDSNSQIQLVLRINFLSR